jgi:valyl-tRNA synthetase
VRAIDTYDLSETVNAPVHLDTGAPDVELVASGVEPNHAAIGPEFRSRAGDVVAALEAADPERIREAVRAGDITVDVDGEPVELTPEMVDVEMEHRAASGEAVEVLETAVGTLLVVP